MQKRTKTFFPLFFILILVSSLLLINNVKADSFYNWIKNPSFIQYSDYIEYGGFENNAWEDGVVYGNWSIESGDPEFSLVKPYTGQYSLKLENDGVYYNLTSSYFTLGSDIIELGGWFWSPAVSVIRITLYYSDSTNTYIDSGHTQQAWFYYDLTGYIESAKTLIAFKFDCGEYYFYVDDVVLIVDDGEGQDSLTGSSTPWYARILVILPDGIDLVNDFGRLDDYSCEFTENALGFDNWIAQDINYLKTEYVHYVDLYYYTVDSTDMSIIVTLFYQDGSSSSREKDLDIDSSWTELNFGVSFVSVSKQIVNIEILVDGVESGDSLYIDDVGLWTSVSIDYTAFEFTVTPSADVKSVSGCFIRTGVTYLFNFYLYNSTMGLSYNGTFALVDATGYTNGTMTLGTFDYMVTPRSYIAEYTYEYFAITITTSDAVYSYSILVVFNNIAGGIEYEVGESVFSTPEGTNWMLLFIMLFLPTMVLVGGLKEVVPAHISFISGFTIMVAVTRVTIPSLMPLWLLFIMVIVIALLLFGMFKRGMF